MTDLEINKALALAIGYLPEHVKVVGDVVLVQRGLLDTVDLLCWLVLGYKDWHTIGPIAERFDCFPYRCPYNKSDSRWGAHIDTEKACYADTPQKAIAMAVIGAKK